MSALTTELPLSVYKKLLQVKTKVPYLQKDKKGFNYTYASPSAVFGQLNPILNEVGLLLITNVIDSKSYEITTGKAEKEKREWKYDLNFIFDWVCVETGQKLSIPWSASGCNGEDKGLGSALTYAERYFVLKQFNIPTDSDDLDSFQDKHMTPEEKKAAEKKAAEEKKVVDAKRKEELQSAIAGLDLASTVKDLTDFKKTLPAYIVSDASFTAAGLARYNVIMATPVQVTQADIAAKNATK